MEQKKRRVTWKTVISSETMKKHLEKNWNKFTDAQLAAMIYRHREWGLQKKCEMLSCLAHETEDKDLSEKIESYFSYLKFAYQIFTEADPNYVFSVYAKHHGTEKENIVGIFKTYDQIQAFIKDYTKCEFCIKKHYLIGQKSDFDEEGFPLEDITVDSESHVKKYRNDSLAYKALCDLFPFEEFPISDPFQKGDVVKVLRGDRYGIIVGHCVKRKNNGKLEEQESFQDSPSLFYRTVRVNILYRNGWRFDCSMSPFDLEKIEFADNDSRKNYFDKMKSFFDCDAEKINYIRMENFVTDTKLFLMEEKERNRNA